MIRDDAELDQTRRYVARLQDIIAQLKQFRRGKSLAGLSLREMIEEGRR